MNPSTHSSSATLAQRAAQLSWLQPLNDVAALDDLLQLVQPTWSLRRVRARVVRVIAESPDTATFVLRANRHWRGFSAGQHVALEVEIDGVRTVRTYSLSSAPQGGRTLALTVKQQEGGKVSSWLHRNLRVGQVVTLSQASGRFTLPAEPSGRRLLFLSAGSGITPVMSMVRDLAARGLLDGDATSADVSFVHACRTPQEALFARELEQLASRSPGLRVHHHHTATSGRLSFDALARLVPDYAQRETFLCGPSGFMELFEQAWAQQGLSERLHTEHFGPVRAGGRGARLSKGTTALEAPVAVRACRSGVTFTSGGTESLLTEAEKAGLSPRAGCRIGICHTCKRRKVSGTVENLLTGEVSSEPDQAIQLCVSAARSALELDL